MRIEKPELRKLVDQLQRQMEKLLQKTGGDPRYAGVEPEGAKAAM